MLKPFERPELLKSLLAGMQDGVSIVSREGIALFVNDAFSRMTGFSPEELLGQAPPYPYWPPEEMAAIEAAFRRTLACEPFEVELVFGTKDGRRVPVIVTASTVRDQAGKVLGHLTTIKDISERKALERALSASEQRWRSIAENPFDFVVVIDRAYRYQYVNHTAPGIALESLIGKATPFDYSAPEHHGAMREVFETTFRTGRATSYDVYSPELDRWYSNIVGPIWEQDEVRSLSILTRDITPQKRAEQQLRDAHKMQTIGTLAGGIAHDLNNILTPILGHAELAQLALEPTHTVLSHLRNIEHAATRARDLVRRILLFGRPQASQKRVIDVGARVAESLVWLKASSAVSIEIVVELPAEPAWVFADPTQLDQLIANLGTNALQAMRDTGGKLTLRLQRVQLPAHARELPPPKGPGTYAALSIIDTGPGMDEETQRRAFEPFFTTTKPPGSGTGLGLSIVHGIAREHGGNVTLVSAPGKGATFTVHLPMAEPAAEGATGGGTRLKLGTSSA
jgi:PAS domain S-box-containing protein